jgi:hypothetical protein
VRTILGRIVVAGMVACAAGSVLPASAVALGRHSYRSPGYRWNRKLPKVAPVVPGSLVTLGDGASPHVLVDAAGTGQIAYTENPSTSASVLRDCVLLRWQTGCAGNAGLIPPESGDPRYNIDEEGPTPLAIGNELLMLSHRFPNVETLPDGTTGYPTFLWTSEDGGRSFTGPGTIGDLEASGNAVVFGGDQPRLVARRTRVARDELRCGPVAAVGRALDVEVVVVGAEPSDRQATGSVLGDRVVRVPEVGIRRDLKRGAGWRSVHDPLDEQRPRERLLIEQPHAARSAHQPRVPLTVDPRDRPA